MIRRWLLRMMLPDEIYLAVYNRVVVSEEFAAHTTFEGADEEMASHQQQSGGQVRAIKLVVD